MPTVLREAAGSATLTGNRFLVKLITPGWGSSGYYGKEVLQQAATDKVFPAGTLMHLDHDSMSEEAERPEGSVKTLAAALTEDAYWSDADGALVAEARGIHPWKEALADAAEFIGVSISAAASFAIGEAEGRKGRIVEALEPHVFNRVDFVTKPGRGGSFTVLESAAEQAKEARNIGQFLEARLHSLFTNLADEFYGDGRLTREEHRTLTTGLSEALLAITTRVEAEAPQLFERDIWDEPTVPSAEESSPAVPAGVNEKKEEATVATIQIEESELTQLRESASRATALEAENKTLKEAAEAEAKEAYKASIEGAVAEAFKGVEAKRSQAAVVAEALAGEYTVEQAAEAAKEAAAEFASLAGAGKPAGLGAAPVQESATADPSEDDIVATLKGA